MTPTGAPSAEGELDGAALAERLLPWFAAAQRDLPWRRDRTPYRVWLSEIMLQQTRVDTVVPYYGRFLARFPDVVSLAEAPLDDVLALWSGLGYYRRARFLHRAAQVVAREHGGLFPRTAAGLRRLPGVGRYTAGAIASLACGEATPIVDGNVARVYTRLFALESDPTTGEGERAMWRRAAHLVPPRSPGPFNEALMELGATVCTPRAPRCDACPLADVCRARAEGRTEELPLIGAKKAPTAVAHLALVARLGGKVVLARRPATGLYAGLWEPPLFDWRGHRDRRAGEAALVAAGKLVGVPTEALTLAGELVHVLSHRRLHVVVVSAALSRLPPVPADRYEEVRPFAARALPALPKSALADRILALASEPSAKPKRRLTRRTAEVRSRAR